MLQNLREHAQGWIAGIICGLLALAFALWGVQYYLQDRSHKQVIAEVDGYRITDQALNVAYERLKRQEIMRSGQRIAFSSMQQAKLKKQALEELISKQALSEDAEENGYFISSDELNSAITELPAFQVNGQFSPNQFQQVLSIMMYTPNEFYEDLTDTLLISQIQMGLTGSAFSLPEEVSSAARLIDQRRDFKYIIIPHLKYINSIKPTAEQIKQYYQQNQSQFKIPAQVKIAYIELSASDIKKRLAVTDQKLKAYYESNISDYSTPRQWQTENILIKITDSSDKAEVGKARIKINSIYSEIKTGADFGELAKKYSDDTTTAKNNGKSDWFSDKERSSIFIQIISELQPGQMSAPFQNSQGFNIVKLIGKKPEKIQSFDKVRQEVEKAYQQQAFQQAFNNESDKLSELTYTNPSSLDDASKALKLPIETTDWFSKKGPYVGIVKNPKVVNVAFSQDVFTQGNNSDLIQLDDTTIVVLRVKDKKPATTKPLSAVSAEITKILQEQQASIAAKNEGVAMLQKLQSGGVDSGWHVETDVSRDRTDINTEILKAAFNQPMTTPKQISYTGMSLTSGDYALVGVTKIMPGQFKKNPKQQEEVVSNEIATNFGQLDYELYVHSVINKAKIKMYKDKKG